jgi:peptidoglycan LD-endopeptidase LytH
MRMGKGVSVPAALATTVAWLLGTTGCSSSSAPQAAPAVLREIVDVPAITDAAPPASTAAAPSPTTSIAQSTTIPDPPTYVFPVLGDPISYGRTHHDYPATDVFGCGSYYLATTAGTINEISTVDRWDPEVNDPATRGGLYVSLIGDDGVRYYGAHLDQVLVAAGDVVAAGDPLGVIGSSGNARASACHLHFGISRPCEGGEWALRRGEIWPWPYLDAWLDGENASPGLEIYAAAQAAPEACEFVGGQTPGT